MIQEFECYIEDIDYIKKEFTALLLDVTVKNDYLTEYATFRFDVFELEDMQFIQLGNYFRWIITEHEDIFIFNKNVFTSEMRDAAIKTANEFKEIKYE